MTRSTQRAKYSDGLLGQTHLLLPMMSCCNPGLSDSWRLLANHLELCATGIQRSKKIFRKYMAGLHFAISLLMNIKSLTTMQYGARALRSFQSWWSD